MACERQGQIPSASGEQMCPPRIRKLFGKPLGASNIVHVSHFLSSLLFGPCVQNVE